MQPEEQNGVSARLLRIFITESSRYQGHPLHLQLLEMLKREGCAGATVTRAIAGYGGYQQIQTGNLADLVPDLPLVVEVVDNPTQLNRVRPRVEQMVENGLVIVQDVEIWKYSYQRRLKEIPANVSIEQIMTRQVASVQLDTPVSDIVNLLLGQHYFKALPVVDQNQKVVGIITDGDLLMRGNVPHRLSVLEQMGSEGIQQLLAELRGSSKVARDIMTSPAVTLRPLTTVRQAARLMLERRLKRIPVIDHEGRLAGIVGRLDVLRLVASVTPAGPGEGGKAPAHSGIAHLAGNKGLTARDIMLTGVPTCSPQTPVEELLGKLVSSNLRRLVVVDPNRKILGVVTDADLVARINPQSRSGVLHSLARGLGLGKSENEALKEAASAADLMTQQVIKASPDASLQELVRLSVENRVKFLPVADEGGHLLGVVLRHDLLQAISESLDSSE